MLQPNYKIYPTLLGKFQDYLDSDRAFEEFWNIDGDGEYKRTADEIAAEREQALLDCVNRVPFESVAADKGTAFNAVIDALLDAPVGVPVRADLFEDCNSADGMTAGTPVMIATVNGVDYTFDTALCEEVAGRLTGAVSQYRCEATLSTKYGDVLLYGYADYILLDKVVDLKTTARYEFLKYERGWQRWLYPWCLVEAGDMGNITAFDYLAVQWQELKGQPLRGKVYNETYMYNHGHAGNMLRSVCERLIEWLGAHREQITDTKVFGA